MIVKTILLAVIGYVIVCAMLFVVQRRMLYFPDSTAPPVAQVQQQGLRHWPSVERFLGFVAQQQPPEVHGTVLVFHGNAGNALHRFFYVQALHHQHVRVVLAEYPGYGGRAGDPSEQTLVEAAKAAMHTAYAQFGPPLYVWGESLGCGVAAAAVRETEVPVAGLVLFLPWDSLASVAAGHYPWVPVRWLLRDTYDSVANLKNFRGPVAMVLAGEDEVIPIRHGKQLYDRLTTAKKLWVMPGVGHNTVPVGIDQPWWREVMDFLRGT